MSKAKKQHWVPRFYLKEFAIPETKSTKTPQVWIFSRFSGDPQRVSIKDIATRRFLYSPLKADGSRDWEVEDKLASLESGLAKIWPELANDYVDLNTDYIRNLVSLFLSTLILRHPGKIEEYENIHNQIVEAFNGLPKDERGVPLISEIETSEGVQKFDSSGWLEFTGPEYSHQKAFIDTLKAEAWRFAELLRTKRWSIVVSEEPVFITTDKPVAIFNQDREKFGIATKGTTINFPLSPTRILMLDDRHEEPSSQYYRLADAGPAPANFTAWTHAHEFMISGRNTDEVLMEFEDLYNAMRSAGHIN